MATRCITATGVMGIPLDILDFKPPRNMDNNPLDLLSPAGMAFHDSIITIL